MWRLALLKSIGDPMKIAALVFAILAVVIVASTYLGHKDGKLAPMPTKPNAVSTQTEFEDKKVAALPFKANTEQTLAAVTKALTEMANNEVKVNDNNYIYTVFTSAKMRYHDDVELYLDEESKMLHFRSQSRAGYSDMGVNRKRYEKPKKVSPCMWAGFFVFGYA